MSNSSGRKWAVRTVPFCYADFTTRPLEEVGRHLEDTLNALEEQGYEVTWEFDPNKTGIVVFGKKTPSAIETSGPPAVAAVISSQILRDIGTLISKKDSFLDVVLSSVSSPTFEAAKSEVADIVRKKLAGVPATRIQKLIEECEQSGAEHAKSCPEPNCPVPNIIALITATLREQAAVSLS